MAGESARAVARRQREKAERLERSASLWERGAEGEEAVAAALAQLPAVTWTVFDDVRWPGRRYANVDHIVVGPPGVFVIDSKNWSGQVTVKAGVLRQSGRSREASVSAAAEAGLAVAGLVPTLEPHFVHPVLCFVREEELSGWARDVMVCSTPNVVALLTSRSAVLAEHEVTQLCLDLDLGLRDAGMPALAASPAERGPRRRSPTSARPAKRRAASSRSRGRGLSAFSRLAVGVAIVGALVFGQDVVTGLAEDVSRLFVENIADTSKPEPKEQPREPAERKRGAIQDR